MNNKVIDLNFAKKSREAILSDIEGNNSMNTQMTIYKMPMRLIMDFHIDLAHLAKGLEVRHYLGKFILSDLSAILNRMSDIAIFLDIDLISQVQEIEIKDPEVILNSLFNHVSMLNYKKSISRAKMINRIVPLFAELVYSIGFTIDELEEHYKNTL